VCSQGDFPPYDLPSERPVRASIALAVLGEMLTEAEKHAHLVAAANVLREARDAVAAAEARYDAD
jgi:hypothetical protein